VRRGRDRVGPSPAAACSEAALGARSSRGQSLAWAWALPATARVQAARLVVPVAVPVGVGRSSLRIESTRGQRVSGRGVLAVQPRSHRDSRNGPETVTKLQRSTRRWDRAERAAKTEGWRTNLPTPGRPWLKRDGQAAGRSSARIAGSSAHSRHFRHRSLRPVGGTETESERSLAHSPVFTDRATAVDSQFRGHDRQSTSTAHG
jgi:hypothetical protein